MTTRETAYAEGQTAKANDTPVERCPYNGNGSVQASLSARVEAHHRDCWFAGHYGEPMPAAPDFYPAQ